MWGARRIEASIMSISNPSLPKSIVALRAYSSQSFLHDLVAGITVGLVALPLAMAFGIASGVTPQAGLYTAVVAGFIISALGGSPAPNRRTHRRIRRHRRRNCSSLRHERPGHGHAHGRHSLAYHGAHRPWRSR